MNLNEREKLILEQLYLKTKLDLNEVMNILNISESTVRRIFSKLEKTGKVIRTHGGISLLGDSLNEYSFESLMQTKYEQKTKIGKAAVNDIVNGDIIYIDCGTTVLTLCISIKQKIKSGELKDLKIFTNSLANIEVLSSVTEICLIGGIYRPNRKDFAGYISENIIKQLHFNKCFLGVDGIVAPDSFTATDFNTARLNQLAISNSEKVFVLCDSSKFGKKSLVSFADASSIDKIITNDDIDEKIIDTFKALNLEVTTV